jgi:hypothetical protein
MRDCIREVWHECVAVESDSRLGNHPVFGTASEWPDGFKDVFAFAYIRGSEQTTFHFDDVAPYPLVNAFTLRRPVGPCL